MVKVAVVAVYICSKDRDTSSSGGEGGSGGSTTQYTYVVRTKILEIMVAV